MNILYPKYDQNRDKAYDQDTKVNVNAVSVIILERIIRTLQNELLKGDDFALSCKVLASNVNFLDTPSWHVVHRESSVRLQLPMFCFSEFTSVQF